MNRIGAVQSYSSVAVGVADLGKALELWIDDFGFELLGQKNGCDADLARLWGISTSDIQRQAVVRTPGHAQGMLHLVQFTDPDPPVREGAAAYDSCPKNLDIYVNDMPTQLEVLKSRGYQFRSDTYSEVTAPDGTRAREIHLLAHDEINVVLLQILDKPMCFSPQGFCGVGPLVTTVSDPDAERQFYQSVLGLELLSVNVLGGPEIEKAIGLPKGSELDFSILGGPDSAMGRIEVVAYRGIRGTDRYPRAKPKSTGILHVSYIVSEMHRIVARLEASRIPFRSLGYVSTLGGNGEAISFQSPAGLRIDVVQCQYVAAI